VLVGIGCSLYRTGGGLPEWYFLSQEVMYLLWPWNFELRFFLPVTPLACLYLWRGGEALLALARHSPRTVGACLLPFLVLLDVDASVWIVESRGLQPLLAVLSWSFGICVAVGMVWPAVWHLLGQFAAWRQCWRCLITILGHLQLRWHILGVVAVVILIGV